VLACVEEKLPAVRNILEGALELIDGGECANCRL
jgi:hypothetical protein